MTGDAIHQVGCLAGERLLDDNGAFRTLQGGVRCRSSQRKVYFQLLNMCNIWHWSRDIQHWFEIVAVLHCSLFKRCISYQHLQRNKHKTYYLRKVIVFGKDKAFIRFSPTGNLASEWEV